MERCEDLRAAGFRSRSRTSWHFDGSKVRDSAWETTRRHQGKNEPDASDITQQINAEKRENRRDAMNSKKFRA